MPRTFRGVPGWRRADTEQDMARGLAYILQPDVSAPDIMTLRKPPSPDELLQLVGGAFVRVPRFNAYRQKPCMVFCRYRCLCEGLPVNPLATLWWHAADPLLSMSDYLAGTVVLIRGNETFMAALEQPPMRKG